MPKKVAVTKKKTKASNKAKGKVAPRGVKKAPASAALKNAKKRNTAKVTKKTGTTAQKSTDVKVPRTISASVKRERKQWANLRNAQLSDKSKVAVEPMRRMIRHAYKDVGEMMDIKTPVERMESKAEKLLLEQGIQYLTEWCSEVQRSVEINRRDKAVDADLASATYIMNRIGGTVPPPSQQSLSRRYSDFPLASVKRIARSSMRSVENFGALKIMDAEEGVSCYKEAKKAARKRKRIRSQAMVTSGGK